MARIASALAFLGAFGVAGFYFFAVFQGPNGYSAYQANSAQVQKMRKENDALRAEIKRRQEAIQKLESSDSERGKAIQGITEKVPQGTTTIILNDPPAEAQ